MTFTVRDKVRLEIGDTDTTAPLFYDDEIDVYLANRADDVLLAAADLCDALATKFAAGVSFSEDGQSFKTAERSAYYAARAKALRERANGIQVIVTTRADGYSDDLSTRDGAGGVSAATGRVRRGYTDPDLPY